ncbi:MAG: hypothetical protein JO051_02290 [Acidobacteriaceae bacterium]|nr:hypothetical protein [Acidobacteriaceae bacterium]
MIWHIFRKDWKLLWPLAVAVIALEAVSVTTSFEAGHFGENRLFSSFAALVLLSVYFGAAGLIAAVIHQDPIVGVRQDWLIRPIKRRDLLIAKLLFLLAVIQGPGLGVFAAMMASAILVAGVHGNPLGATSNSGIQWIPEASRYVVYALTAAFILSLQYFRRKTLQSRYAFAIAVLLCIGTALMPWRLAFAVQERLSTRPAVGERVRIEFDQSLGRFEPASKVDLQANLNKMLRQARMGGPTVYLPLRVAGLAADSILRLDRSAARVIPVAGRAETLTISSELGDDLEVHNDGAGRAETLVHQPIRVRSEVYERFKNDFVRLEIDDSFSLMKLSAAHAVPALDGDQRTPETGWCRTRLNESATDIQIACLKVGELPFDCINIFLENSSTGARNPGRSGCAGSYQPYFGRYQPIDTLSRFGLALPFHDPGGLAKYPVDGSQLAQAYVVIRLHKAQDHFTRHLVFSGVRLSDWMPR